MTAVRTAVLLWDWRQQPDLDALSRAITDLSGGTLHLHQVNTGSDEYAIVLATGQLDAEAAQAAYQQTWDIDDRGEVAT
jgi:hypothetical protein